MSPFYCDRTQEATLGLERLRRQTGVTQTMTPSGVEQTYQNMGELIDAA
jgi:hypothetical protein